MSLFCSLGEVSRRQLIAAYNNVKLEHVELGKTVMLNGQYPDRVFAADYMVMLRACRDGLIDVLRELLDMGLSPDLVGTAPLFISPQGARIATGNRCVIPLAWVPHSSNAVDMAKLLLDRGASPNFTNGTRYENGDVSPMHAACGHPELLELLIAHGGDVKLVGQDGWSVLDHWLWHMHGPSKADQAPGLRALDVMLANGLDPHQKLHDGGSFLTSCWASGFLRRHTHSFIAKGFDPHQRGSARAAKGNSWLCPGCVLVMPTRNLNLEATSPPMTSSRLPTP